MDNGSWGKKKPQPNCIQFLLLISEVTEAMASPATTLLTTCLLSSLLAMRTRAPVTVPLTLTFFCRIPSQMMMYLAVSVTTDLVDAILGYSTPTYTPATLSE